MTFAKFTPQARRRWELVPGWAQSQILQAVWCGNCLKGTPMELRAGTMENECLILEGKCKTCGNNVVRVIEPEE